jgi:hypothetical protein
MATEERVKIDLTAESTSSQGGMISGWAMPPSITMIPADGMQLANRQLASWSTYRELRKDPTIALARAASTVAILCGAWTYECDDEVDDDVVKFIQDNLDGFRQQFLEQVLYGGIDYGWVAFEKVFKVNNDGNLVLEKLKHLYVDQTNIVVHLQTGAYLGIQQGVVYLDKEKTVRISFRVEGTNWYGYPLLENSRITQRKWEDAEDGAARYDRKIAGSHWVVYYPPGSALLNGVDTPNAQIAAALLTTLESSGAITVPKTVAKYLDELKSETYEWKIELISDSGGRQPQFIERLRYLDTLKVRGLLIPERSVLEGQFGTKAEAGVHTQMSVLMMENNDRFIAKEVNGQIVDQLLMLNYGNDMKGKVRIKPAPLQDVAIDFLRTLYAAMIANPAGFAEEFGTIDTDSLKDKLEVPKRTEIAQAGESNLPPAGVDPVTLMNMTKTIKPPVPSTV